MWLLNLKNTLWFMRKKPHDRILREEPKKQHLNTVPKSCSSSKDRTYGKPRYETLIILPLFFKWQNLATKLDNLQPYSIFFLLGVNFDKSTIELDFFFLISFMLAKFVEN